MEGQTNANTAIVVDVNAPGSFAAKLAAQLEKATSKREVIDKIITIKDISVAVTKHGEVQEHRRRIIDTNGTHHYCFANQLSNERLAAGMKATVSFAESKDGNFVNVIRVTPVLESLNAQQLAYLSGNPIVIPAM